MKSNKDQKEKKCEILEKKEINEKLKINILIVLLKLLVKKII